jgi:nitroreductase
MDYDSFLELVKKTRSIRRFKSDSIPDDYIDKIIEAARWAPSGFNSQPWDFIVVKEKALRDKIIQLISEFRSATDARLEEVREPWMKSIARPVSTVPMDWRTAPVFIVLCGDTRTQVGLPMTVRTDYRMCQSIFISSMANTFLYLHMAATTLDLASVWVSAVGSTPLHLLVKNILGIPGEFEVYDMLALGYPAVKPRPKLLKAKEKTIHYDYSSREDFRTDEEVYDFARRTRNWTIASIRRGPD